MKTIEEIALEVAKEVTPEFVWEEGCNHESGVCKYELYEFAQAFLARIDAERGKAEVLQAQEPQRLKVVYAASNSVSSVVFANHDDAVKYAANCGAACGVTVTEIQVTGTAPQPPVTCQCADPEQIIALQHAADTAEAQALDNEKLRAEVERLTKELSDCKVIMNMACTDNEKAQAERIAAQSAALAKARESLASAGNTLREVTLWQKPCVNDVRLAKTALPAVRDGIAAIDALGSAVKDYLTTQSDGHPEGEKVGAQ